MSLRLPPECGRCAKFAPLTPEQRDNLQDYGADVDDGDGYCSNDPHEPMLTWRENQCRAYEPRECL